MLPSVLCRQLFPPDPLPHISRHENASPTESFPLPLGENVTIWTNEILQLCSKTSCRAAGRRQAFIQQYLGLQTSYYCHSALIWRVQIHLIIVRDNSWQQSWKNGVFNPRYSLTLTHLLPVLLTVNGNFPRTETGALTQFEMCKFKAIHYPFNNVILSLCCIHSSLSSTREEENAAMSTEHICL